MDPWPATPLIWTFDVTEDQPHRVALDCIGSLRRCQDAGLTDDHAQAAGATGWLPGSAGRTPDKSAGAVASWALTLLTRQPPGRACSSVSEPGETSKSQTADSGAPSACATAHWMTAPWVTATRRSEASCQLSSSVLTRRCSCSSDSPPWPAHAGSPRQARAASASSVNSSSSERPAHDPRSHGPRPGSTCAPSTRHRSAGEVKTPARTGSTGARSAGSSSGRRPALVADVPPCRTSRRRSEGRRGGFRPAAPPGRSPTRAR